jgi:hypothetical protein
MIQSIIASKRFSKMMAEGGRAGKTREVMEVRGQKKRRPGARVKTEVPVCSLCAKTHFPSPESPQSSGERQRSGGSMLGAKSEGFRNPPTLELVILELECLGCCWASETLRLYRPRPHRIKFQDNLFAPAGDGACSAELSEKPQSATVNTCWKTIPKCLQLTPEGTWKSQSAVVWRARDKLHENSRAREH